MNKKGNIIVIGVVCFILTFAILIQIRTILHTNSMVIETTENAELRDSVIKWQEKYDQSIVDMEEAENKLKAIRQDANQNNPEAAKKEEELLNNNINLGLTDVKGPGVSIILADNESATASNIGLTEDIKDYLVHDSNLREVVRKLKNSGAEAISINDQRVVFNTSITCSGNVIRVNDIRIGSPFEIKAIGSPELLYGNLEPTIKKLNNLGIKVDIEKSENISINKYNGTIQQNYAKSVE